MYQKYNDESKSIRWSMIVLSLSFVLVYIVLFYVKGDSLKNGLSVDKPDHNLAKNDITISNVVDTGLVDHDVSVNTGVKIKDEDVVVNIPDKQLEDTAILNNEDTNEDTIVLSGTKTYYGKLDFVEKLGISYKYALKDDKNMYYLNMGDYDYDFSDIVRKLKGSLYVMNTEQELIANGLFGEKVTFINIPEYKNEKVLMLLEINNGSWLLAIDYSIYHQVKPYLKTLFID